MTQLIVNVDKLKSIRMKVNTVKMNHMLVKKIKQLTKMTRKLVFALIAMKKLKILCLRINIEHSDMLAMTVIKKFISMMKKNMKDTRKDIKRRIGIIKEEERKS